MAHPVVSRYEHGSAVVLVGVARIGVQRVAVPSWVECEGAGRSHRRAVLQILRQGVVALAAVEVAFGKERIGLAVNGRQADIVGIAVAVQQFTEDGELGFGMHDFGHVWQLLGHPFEDVQVAVLAGDVLLHDALAVDVAGAGDIAGSAVGQFLQVLAREVILRHEVGQEMHHRRGTHVEALRRTLAAIDITLIYFHARAFAHARPVVHLQTMRIDAGRVHDGEILCVHDGNGVVDVHAGGTAEAGAFRGGITRRVAEQLDEVGVVDHRRLQQVLLFRLRQLADAREAALLQEYAPRIVVGHEQCHAARATQHLGIVGVREVGVIDES